MYAEASTGGGGRLATARFGIQINITLAGAQEAQDGLRGVGAAGAASAQEVADLKEKVSELSTELADLKEKSDAGGESLSSVKDVLGEFGVVTSVTAALGLLVDVMKDWVAEAAEVERISTQLVVKVRATGEGAGWTAEQLDIMAQRLEAGSRFTEPMIKSAENLLLSFTNIKGANFPAALQSIADISANTGRDIEGTATLIGKALDQPIHAFGVLRKAGVDVDEAEKEAIKTMVEHGDMAGAQALLLQSLSKFMGAAAADAHTLSGQWAIMKRDADEAGGKIIQLSGAFDLLKSATSNPDAFGKGLLGIAAIAELVRAKIAEIFSGILDLIAKGMQWVINVEMIAVQSLLSVMTAAASVMGPVGAALTASLAPVVNAIATAVTSTQEKIRSAVEGGSSYFNEIAINSNAAAVAMVRQATVVDELGKSHEKLGNSTAAVTKQQQAFNDMEEKAVQAMQAKLAKAREEADAAVAGAGAVKLHTASLAADAEVEKLRTEARQKGVAVDEDELIWMQMLGVMIDQETTRKQLNILVSKQREEDEKIAAATLAKVTDAENQNTTASVIAAAVAKERAAILATTVPIESDAARALLAHAESEGRATAMALGYVAAIKESQAQVVAMRTAQAALTDEVTRGNTASIAAAQLTKAEAEARKEGYTEDNAFEALAFQARVNALVQQAQVLQGVKDEGTARKELNAIYDSGVQSAINTTAQLLAQLGVYSEINPQVGALASHYQSLFTAEGYVAYQELLLQTIRKQGIDLATQEGQLKAQLLAADLAGVSQQVQAYKQLDAVLQQRATDEKAVADSISRDWDTLFQGIAEGGAGMAVNWKNIWQGMEKTVIDSIASMLAHAAETNLVQALFGQGATLQTALFGGGPQGGANAQFQSAVTQFGGFVAQLSGGGALGGLGGALGGAGNSLTNAGDALKGSAHAGQEFASTASEAFAGNSASFTTNSQNIDVSTYGLDSAATALLASAGAQGTSNLTSGLGNAGVWGVVAMIAITFYQQWTSDHSEGKGTAFDPNSGGLFGIGGQTGGTQGAAGGTEVAYSQAGQQIADGLKAFFLQFQAATGQILTALPELGVRISEDGKNFQAIVNGKVVGTFASLGDAMTVAIETGLGQSNLKNLPQVVQDYIKSLSAPDANGMVAWNTSSAQMLQNVQILEQVTNGAHGAISKITTDMQSYVDTMTQESAALVNMGLSATDLATMLKDANSGLVALDTAERDSIIGKKLTVKQQQELDRETYNNALALQEAQIQQQIIQLQVEALGIAGQGAYINGLGMVAGATVDAAGIQAKSAGVMDASNKLLLDSINQAIQSDQDLLKQLAGLTIKPGDLKAPAGSGASSTVTTLASAIQTMQQAMLALQQQGMLPFDAALLKINDDIDRQEKGLKANSQAYRDLEAARAADIALLREQTQANTDALVTPLIQQAHGLSVFTVALDALRKKWDDVYKTEQDLGAGAAELARVRRAELQDEHNLIMQYVGALSLPLDTTAADAGKFALAVQALAQGLTDGAVSAGQFAAEMAQIQQQGQVTILGMIQGIYQAAGDSADAAKVKAELDQIDFQIKLAQLEEETQIILAQGVITQALADRVAGIEAYFAAHPPDFARLDAPAVAAHGAAASAASSLASALQSAIDSLRKFDASLDQSSTLSPLTAQQKEDAAMAAFQADLAGARKGDAASIADLTTTEQALLTQARAFYGSESPYTDIYKMVRADNAGIIGSGGYVASANQAQSLGYASTYTLPPPAVVTANTAPVVGAVQSQAAQAAKDSAELSRKLDTIGTVVTAIDSHRRQTVTETNTLGAKLDQLAGIDAANQGQMARLLGLLERRAG